MVYENHIEKDTQIYQLLHYNILQSIENKNKSYKIVTTIGLVEIRFKS